MMEISLVIRLQAIGDIDNNGTPDIAVGAINDDTVAATVVQYMSYYSIPPVLFMIYSG